MTYTETAVQAAVERLKRLIAELDRDLDAVEAEQRDLAREIGKTPSANPFEQDED